LPLRLRHLPRLRGDRGDESAALTGQLAQLVALQLRLRLPQRVAERDHLGQELRPVPTEQVDRPRGDRRTSERLDCGRELPVPRGTRLLLGSRAGAGELSGAEPVELVGDLAQPVLVHASTLGARATP
jgi:hypothetical protein